VTASVAQTVLDYLRTFVWPAVTVSLIVFFLVRFRRSVAGLLDRITEARGPAGVRIAAAPPPSQDASSPVTPDPEIIEEIVGEYEERLQREQEAEQQTIEYWQHQTVEAQLSADFERTYRLIFGSQILALRSIDGAYPGSLPRSQIEVFFELMKAHDPASAWSFEQWLRFLLIPSVFPIGTQQPPLVEQLADGTFKITDRGRAFTGFLELIEYPSAGYPAKTL
jgi:hypothetical protein